MRLIASRIRACFCFLFIGLVKNDRLRVNGKKFDFDSHLVNKNRLPALNLIKGTNSREEVDDRVMVFNTAMGNQGEG